MESSAPPARIRSTALLIWLLSKKPDLGLCFILTRAKKYHFEECDLGDHTAIGLMLLSWLKNRQVKEQVESGLSSFDDRYRCIADDFLIKTLLVQYIIDQNGKGLTVDLNRAVGKYIRLWSYRPKTQAVSDRLARLVWHRNTRRHFGVDLRKEWGLALTKFQAARDLRHHEILYRVRVCPLESHV